MMREAILSATALPLQQRDDAADMPTLPTAAGIIYVIRIWLHIREQLLIACVRRRLLALRRRSPFGLPLSLSIIAATGLHLSLLLISLQPFSLSIFAPDGLHLSLHLMSPQLGYCETQAFQEADLQEPTPQALVPISLLSADNLRFEVEQLRQIHREKSVDETERKAGRAKFKVLN